MDEDVFAYKNKVQSYCIAMPPYQYKNKLYLNKKSSYFRFVQYSDISGF
jgi:hypothetical protein